MSALGEALAGFPAYFLSFLVGFLTVTLTDVNLTSLAIFGIALGFVTSPLVGVTGFMGFYVLVRQLDSISASIQSRRQ